MKTTGRDRSRMRLIVATVAITVSYVLLGCTMVINNATFLIFGLSLGVLSVLVGVGIWFRAVARESREKGVL